MADAPHSPQVRKETTMEKKNPYATNKGGYIKAPNAPAAGDPRATKTVASNKKDLRCGK